MTAILLLGFAMGLIFGFAMGRGYSESPLFGRNSKPHPAKQEPQTGS